MFHIYWQHSSHGFCMQVPLFWHISAWNGSSMFLLWITTPAIPYCTHTAYILRFCCWVFWDKHASPRLLCFILHILFLFYVCVVDILGKTRFLAPVLLHHTHPVPILCLCCGCFGWKMRPRWLVYQSFQTLFTKLFANIYHLRGMLTLTQRGNIFVRHVLIYEVCMWENFWITLVDS